MTTLHQLSKTIFLFLLIIYSRNFQTQSFGQVDYSFQPSPGISRGFYNVFPAIKSIVIQNDNKILIGGSFSDYNGKSRNRIARINIDGSLDNSFNPGTGADFGKNGIGVECVAIQSDNKILIGGDFTLYNNYQTPNHLIRLENDGRIDFTFNSHNLQLDRIEFIIVQSDEKILIAGSFDDITNYRASTGRLYRLNKDGSLDTTFQLNSTSNLKHPINSLELQPDGKILLTSRSISRSNIARLNSDGSIDESFPTDFYGMFINTSKILSDGKILIIGETNEDTENKIMKLNSDGTIDENFYSGTFSADYGYSPIYSVIENNGKIIVGGDFKSFDNININRILALNSDGTIDNSFNLGIGPDDVIFKLLNQNDNKILLGGGFTSYDNNISKGIVRIFNNSGTLLTENKTQTNQNKLLIYPNPINEILNIKSLNLNIKDIRILNLNGQTIMTKKNIKESDSNHLNLNLKTLLNGNYFLNVNYSDGRKETYKLIKK